MPLIQHTLSITDHPLPVRPARYIEVASARIREFTHSPVSDAMIGFVPSDYQLVYRTLDCLLDLTRGRRFCEWGSGFGVVAGLATMLGFQAYGIEVESILVQESIRLADEFNLNTQFVEGSFVPTGGPEFVDVIDQITCLDLDRRPAYGALGIDPDEFDAIFVYPWPGETRFVNELFETFAPVGAFMVSFHGRQDVRVHEKVTSTRRRN